jgi:F-type H+-transporting ATPase subunit b
MPQLDVATYSSQIFWLILCVSTLYVSLKYVFIPRLESSIDARKRKIEVLCLDAKKMQIESDKLNEQYAEEIKKVHVEAYRVHKKALKEFEEDCSNKIKKLSEKQASKLAEFREELNMARKDFSVKIEAQSEILLAQFTKKISSGTEIAKDKKG